MRTLDEICEDARPRSVFHDGNQYTGFESRNCVRCLVDTTVCPLVDAAFLGFHPVEWVPRPGPGLYRCKALERIPA